MGAAAEDYDEPTGTVFCRINRSYGFVQMNPEDELRLGGRRISLGSHGYAQMWDDGRVVCVHRWIMGCKVGDGRIVDHINRDRLDNRRCNLRFVTAADNTQNRETHPLRGAGSSRNSSKWHARVKHNGITHREYGFATAEEAAARATEMRRELLGPYAT